MDYEPNRTFPKKGGNRGGLESSSRDRGGKADRRERPGRGRGGKQGRGRPGRGRGGKQGRGNFNGSLHGRKDKQFNKNNTKADFSSSPTVYEPYKSDSEDEIQEIPTVNSGQSNRLQSEQFNGYGYTVDFNNKQEMDKAGMLAAKRERLMRKAELNMRKYGNLKARVTASSPITKDTISDNFDDVINDEEESKDSEESATLSDEDIDMEGKVDEIDDEGEAMNDEEEGSAEEDDEDEAANFKKEISNMPMSKVRELRDQLGLKLFNKLYFSKEEGDSKEPASKKKKIEKKVEKKGQHRPREMSSKKPVSAFQEAYKNQKKVRKWDPRFDERAGTYREDRFMEDYEFLDEVRHSELKEMQQELLGAVEANDRQRALKLSHALEKMENRERARKEKKLINDTKAELRQQNIDRMLTGQKPIYKKKSEVNMIIAEKKFEQLKKEKRLGKYMKNKAKKQSEKEKKKKSLIELD